MKLVSITALAALAILAANPQRAFAEGNQVFYRYGKANLKNSRAGQVFTDTASNLGAGPSNNSTSGWNVGAGLDLAMLPAAGPGDLVGEVQATYAHYSAVKVRQASTALLSQNVSSDVTVSGLEVVIAPKYRFAFLEGKLRPWIIPVGLAFLVNSPPSNDTNYLDVGLQFGVGVEYMVLKAVSLGADFRYTTAFKEPNVDMSHNAADLYAGINF